MDICVFVHILQEHKKNMLGIKAIKTSWGGGLPLSHRIPMLWSFSWSKEIILKAFLPNSKHMEILFYSFYFPLCLEHWHPDKSSYIEHTCKGCCITVFGKGIQDCAVDNYWIQVVQRDISDKWHTLKINLNLSTDIEKSIICSCLEWII